MSYDENSIAAKHVEDDGDEAFFQRLHRKAKDAMGKATFCRHCDGEPTFTYQGVGEHMAVYCEACGDEKGVGFGNTPGEAVAAWNVQNGEPS